MDNIGKYLPRVTEIVSSIPIVRKSVALGENALYRDVYQDLTCTDIEIYVRVRLPWVVLGLKMAILLFNGFR